LDYKLHILYNYSNKLQARTIMWSTTFIPNCERAFSQQISL